jgi:hypothetical protein
MEHREQAEQSGERLRREAEESIERVRRDFDRLAEWILTHRPSSEKGSLSKGDDD